MMKTLSAIFTIFAKETTDNLRDRRSMLIALIYPLMGPVLLGILISAVTQKVVTNPNIKLPVAVWGAERAPDLVRFLGENGLEIRPTRQDPETSVRQGRFDVVLAIEPDFAAMIAAQRPAPVRIVADGTKLAGTLAMARVQEALGKYGQALAAERLKQKGLAPDIVAPIKIDTKNVAEGSQLADFFLYMIPPFLIFTVFLGGVYLAIDATAGERERGSLEPLLANPVERWALMAGKFLAALSFTALAVAVQLIAFRIMFDKVGGPGSGFERELPLMEMISLFGVALPLMLVAVGIQMIIATVSRSFKEAQTYLGLLPLIPAMPGLGMVFVPLKAQAWMMCIPTFGQTVLFGQIIRGEAVSAYHLGLSVSVTAAFGLLLAYFGARLYEREELLFSN